MNLPNQCRRLLSLCTIANRHGQLVNHEGTNITEFSNYLYGNLRRDFGN